MSDLPLLPVYLAGAWPAASWYTRHSIEQKRHPERIFNDDTEEIARDGLWSLPDALRFTNYVEAWVGGNVLVYARNSLLVTIPATLVSIT